MDTSDLLVPFLRWLWSLWSTCSVPHCWTSATSDFTVTKLLLFSVCQGAEDEKLQIIFQSVSVLHQAHLWPPGVRVYSAPLWPWKALMNKWVPFKKTLVGFFFSPGFGWFSGHGSGEAPPCRHRCTSKPNDSLSFTNACLPKPVKTFFYLLLQVSSVSLVQVSCCFAPQ